MPGVERAVRCWVCGKPFDLREAHVVVELTLGESEMQELASHGVNRSTRRVLRHDRCAPERIDRARETEAPRAGLRPDPLNRNR